MCPGCGTQSARVHSRDERQLSDAALSNQQTVLPLFVRRFSAMTRGSGSGRSPSRYPIWPSAADVAPCSCAPQGDGLQERVGRSLPFSSHGAGVTVRCDYRSWGSIRCAGRHG
ncbi:transposase family protein [Streptomyces aureus]